MTDDGSVQRALADVAAACGFETAVALQRDQESDPVIVVEAVPGSGPVEAERAVATILERLSERGIAPAELLVVAAGRIGTHGLDGAEGARRLEDEDIEVLYGWIAPISTRPGSMRAATKRSQPEIIGWLQQLFASELRCAPEEIAVDMPMAELGVDSEKIGAAMADFEVWLGADIDITDLWDHPTIFRLAGHLAGTCAEPRVTADPASGPSPVSNVRRPIAIVGIGCRLSGVEGPTDLWDVLAAGGCRVGPAPATRPDRAGTTGAFLDDIDGFDRRFFRTSPREAERMDPQQRFLLEVAWEALEDSGIPPGGLAGTHTGVFVGLSENDFQLAGFRRANSLDPHTLTGTSSSIAANRISYQLDLHGPSMTVDTACSSSLVAVHLACQSVQLGESVLALAAGVNLLSLVEVDDALASAGMTSPDGTCRAFDEDANGYVRGEGCIVVVLKALDAAVRDGDRVYAVIEGSAVGQDGRSNGLTAPNRSAQREVIRRALRTAGRSPSDLVLIEAHGTGTPLGDPVEMSAIEAVLDEDPPPRPAWVGSAKPGFGHLEACAGLLGLLRATLAIHHGSVPVHINLAHVNGRITQRHTRFPGETTPLDRDRPLVAGVSSFGFGGTLAHVVISEGPIGSPPRPSLDPPVLVLSGRDHAALDRQRERLRDLLERSVVDMPGLRRTLNTGRERFPHQVAVIADTQPEAMAALEERNDDPGAQRVPLVAVFGGQGVVFGEHLGELVRHSPVIRERLVAASDVLSDLGRGLDVVRSVIEAPPGTLTTDVAQPLLFAVSAALSAHVRGLGVTFDAVVGHSVGELVAVHTAGGVSFEDGLRFATERGVAMQERMARGAMAVVIGDDHRLDELIESANLVVTADNAPGCRTVAGAPDALADAVKVLEAHRCTVRQLGVDRAFHTADVDACLGDVAAAAQHVDWRSCEVPVFSTVDGIRRDAGWQADAGHWCDHARLPVRFAQALRDAVGDGAAVIELSPGRQLRSLGRRVVGGVTPWILGADDRGSLRSSTARCVAGLVAAGQILDLRPLFPPGSAPLVEAPTYPFERAEPPAPGTSTAAEDTLTSTSQPPGTTLPAGGFHVAELEGAAARLARTLLGLGVGPTTTIAVAADQAIVAVTAALCARRLGLDVQLMTEDDEQFCAAVVVCTPEQRRRHATGLAPVVTVEPPPSLSLSAHLDGSDAPLRAVGDAPIWPTVQDATLALTPQASEALVAHYDRAIVDRGPLRLVVSTTRATPLTVVQVLWGLERGHDVVFERLAAIRDAAARTPAGPGVDVRVERVSDGRPVLAMSNSPGAPGDANRTRLTFESQCALTRHLTLELSQ